MTKLRIRRLFSRILLAVAYLALTLQWLWVLATGLPPLIETGVFDSFTSSTPIEPATPTQPSDFSPFLAVVAGVVTLLFLVITIVVFIKLPKTISNTGERVVHQTAEAIIPVLTHHKKLPARKKHLISRRITIALQLLLVVAPLSMSFFIPSIETITSQIITTLAIWLAGISTACFVGSWLLEPKVTLQTRSRASRE